MRFVRGVSDRELTAYYHAADLFVLPSVTRAEAFGVVQLEAMSCGVPVICTDLPSGVPWVNRHGESGLVVPPGDPEALRAAIEELLDDESRRREMGDYARERVATEFSLERMAARTTDLYQRVVQRA